jgi:aromatic ring-cleaving dioxygenase
MHPSTSSNSPQLFDKVVSWLMLKHRSLDVLVHPLGTLVELGLDTLRSTYRAEQYPTA